MGKKIVVVNAGPRKGWNTDTLLIDIPESDAEAEWLEKQNFKNTKEGAYTG